MSHSWVTKYFTLRIGNEKTLTLRLGVYHVNLARDENITKNMILNKSKIRKKTDQIQNLVARCDPGLIILTLCIPHQFCDKNFASISFYQSRFSSCWQNKIC